MILVLYNSYKEGRSLKRLVSRVVIEKYDYDSNEERMEHGQFMEEQGYTDTGMISSFGPDKDGVFRRVPRGEYIFKEQYY